MKNFSVCMILGILQDQVEGMSPSSSDHLDILLLKEGGGQSFL